MAPPVCTPACTPIVRPLCSPARCTLACTPVCTASTRTDGRPGGYRSEGPSRVGPSRAEASPVLSPLPQEPHCWSSAALSPSLYPSPLFFLPTHNFLPPPVMASPSPNGPPLPASKAGPPSALGAARSPRTPARAAHVRGGAAKVTGPVISHRHMQAQPGSGPQPWKIQRVTYRQRLALSRSTEAGGRASVSSGNNGTSTSRNQHHAARPAAAT